MIIYFRHDRTTIDEFEIAKKYFDVVDCRTDLCRFSKHDVVLCRYSALPFNKELETDIKNLGMQMINSSSEHEYIASMAWYYDIPHLTFDTWFDSSQIPDTQLVVKGVTNSRKFEWNKKMFAKNKTDAINIGCDLMQDSLIGPQGVVYRRYEKLKTFEIGINDMPMTNEWRCFFVGDKLVSYGFYWSSATDETLSRVNRNEFENSGLQLAKEAAKILSENCTFFVVDVAQKDDGSWIVVEINDGQMSGLSMIDPDAFYSNLKRHC